MINMALTAKQIYTIVNEVAQQAMGAKAIAVIDNTGLIALGNTVLGSSDTVNNFINALTDRIGRTIVSFRAYHSHFPDFERDSIEWGNILQKLKVGMPDAEEDQSYNLLDGESVDQYKINKAKVNQLLFTTETPWQTHITVHLDELEKAFIDSTSMGTFISSMFGEVQNRIELAMENLSMDCVNNYIAEIYSRREVAGTENRTFKLVTMYNVATGVDYTTEPLKALDDEEFLKFTVRTINRISSTMEYMTTGIFNTPGNIGDVTNKSVYTRHTPKSEQKLMLFIDMVNALKTNINSKAFNMEQVAIDIPFMTVPFWQAIDSPSTVNINKTASNEVATVNNVIGILFDREAMGTYKKQYNSLTSPVNAAGRYYNVFYHMRTLFFNDLTENAVIFVLE